VLFLGILIPALIIFDLVAEQAISLYGNANDWFKNMSVEERQGYWSAITSSRLYTLLRLDTVDWGSIAQQDFKAFGSLVTKVVNKTSQGVAGVITGVFITFFIMFYFFMDGEGLVRKLKYLSPLRNEYNNMIAERFALISRATVKGTVLIGLAQGSIGSLVLMIAGLNTWLLWGFVMVVLSIIPMVGAWLVLMPIAIFELLQGKIWQGLLILITCTVVVSNVDNLLRPRLVGRDAKLHDLMIFFSTLGGIALFGVMGFIVGPVIAALFVTILDIYAEEFKPQLSRLQSEDERNTL
jgi:predicted PurR-regulated permease PerM